MKVRESESPVLKVDFAHESSASPAAGVKALPPADAPAAEPARADLERAVERANRQMASVAPSLQFEIDSDTQALVIRLVDRHDQSVLRQVPSPEMLAIAKALDRMQSYLVRSRA